LSEAFDYFISSAKEDFVDSRYKNVNFATVFPEQVRRLYNNLLTDDFEVFAPRAKGLAQIDFGSPTVTLAYPTWSAIGGLGSFGDDMQLVDPDWGWNERIFAMVWGAMYFTSNWSYDWLHQARIAALPTELPSWPDDAIYAFVDPKTGQTYRAHSSGKETLLGLTRQKSAGARMLEWANKLVTVAYEVERDDDDEPITDKYGTPVLKLKNGAPELDKDHPGADLVLQRYVAQIDMFRQITAAFEQPLDALPDL
jgi:hypothetical protein